MAPSNVIAALLLVTLAAMPLHSHAAEDYSAVNASIVRGDYARARRLLDEIARRGDTLAMYRLANLYRAGTGIPQNLTESLRLYERAAELGHVPSQYMTGQCYERGIGTPRNAAKAGEWYARAAHAGDTRAAQRLGDLADRPADLLTIIGLPDEASVIAQLADRDLSTVDDQGETLLMAASAAGRVRVVEYLLAAKLDVNQRDHAQRTALFYAAEQGRDAVIDALLGAGAAASVADSNGDTPLHIAIAQRRQTSVERLLRGGADLSARNGAGWSAEQLARAKSIAASRSTGPVESLDPTAQLAGLRKDKRFDGWPELSIAAWNGDLKLVERLVTTADVDAHDASGHTALSRAVDQGRTSVVDRLLAHSARTDVNLPGSQTPLLIAIERRYDPIAAALLRAGAPTAAVDTQGRFALGLAASRNDADMVVLLLEHHADPNVRGGGGRTALMIAAQAGAVESVRKLLERGASADLNDDQHRSSVWYSADSQDPVDLTLLLAALESVAPAEKFGSDMAGVSPLHRAVGAHATGCIEALLKAQHDPNVASEAGSTPLHLAAMNGDLSSATLLTSAGADLERRDSQGSTPLLLAVKAHQFDTTKYLLQKGADPRIRNANSASAYDLARNDPDPRWAAMFDEHSKSLLSALTDRN